MKKLFFVLVLSVFTAIAVSAQEPETVTLKLKNGISLTGQIIEETGEIFKVKTAEGDVFIYRTDEISRIEGRDSFGNVSMKERVKKSRPAYFKKGYRSLIELSGSGCIGGYANNRISITYVGGYNISPYFYFGLGTGLALTDMLSHCTSYDIPIYLHLRSAFMKYGRVSPFISLNLGYNATIVSDSVGYSSVYFEPTIGAEIRLNQKRAISIGLTSPIMPGTVRRSSDYFGIGGKVTFSF